MTIPESEVVKRVRGVNPKRLRLWTERGWIKPALGQTGYIYTEIDVARTDLIRQLRDDLDVERDSVPLFLSLLDQIYGLRRELRNVTRAIEQQPEEVRRRILAWLKQPGP